jgi:hypothetical protein
MAEVRREVQVAGRNPDAFEVSLFGMPPDAGLLRQARDAGVARCVLGLPSAQADKVLPVLDRHAELMRRLG